MAAPIGPLSVTAFPQHMVAASQQGVLLITTTATPSGPPQAVLMAPYSALTSGIMNVRWVILIQGINPLMMCNGLW